MFLDAFHGDVHACTTVAVVLMTTRLALEPLPSTVRSLCVSTDWTPLARVLGINPRGRNPSNDALYDVVLKGAEREVVQASVHPGAVVDTVAHLFEVFKDNARILEPLAPLHDVTAHFVEPVTDEPFLTPFQRVLDTRLPAFWTRFRIVK